MTDRWPNEGAKAVWVEVEDEYVGSSDAEDAIAAGSMDIGGKVRLGELPVGTKNVLGIQVWFNLLDCSRCRRS